MAHRSLTLSRAFHPIRTPKSILLYLNLFYCVLSITYIYIYIYIYRILFKYTILIMPCLGLEGDTEEGGGFFWVSDLG